MADENQILNLKSKVSLNCSICDKCCEYRGNIKITPINVLQISRYLRISTKEFLKQYTENVENSPEIVIKGIGEKRNCILNNQENHKCMIQPVKPMQCVVFPLVPIDIRQDLFVDSHQCHLRKDKMITVDKWLNGNHHIYQKNKEIYLKWIDLIEEMKPKWPYFSEEKKKRIRSILYDHYAKRKSDEKQVLENIQMARREYLLY